MKLKNTLLGFSGLSAMFAIVIFFSNVGIEERVYSPRESNKLQSYFNYKHGIQGAIEYYKERKKNIKTGEIELSDIREAKKHVEEFSKQKSAGSLGLSWEEMGPDDVGGRTRAILIDKNNTNKVYAGSVSGGLWISNNAGNTWNAYDDFLDNLGVSCITQASNGDIYFGTGESFAGGGGTNQGTHGGVGNGIWKSSDGGVTFTHLSSTENNSSNDWAYVNRLAADNTDPNKIYAATGDGLKMSTDGGATWNTSIWANPPTNTIPIASSFQDLRVASNGTVLTSTGGGAYRKGPGDTDFSAITTSLPGVGGAGRLEFCFSPSDPNYAYCCATSGNLHNLYQSTDNGVTWNVIVPGGSGPDHLFGDNTQGWYDLAVGVFPDDPEHILVGGVELYGWSGTDNVWDIAALTGWHGSSLYIHADKHTFEFHPDYDGVTNAIFYVGTDGGVFRSADGGVSYEEVNRGYNVTQFYAIGTSREGWVCGGTQDNGNPFIDFTGNSTKGETYNLPSGDGGYMQFSVVNPDAFFWESQNGMANRSPDKAASSSGLYQNDAVCGGACDDMESIGPWVTPLVIWENFNDINSKDSVLFIADRTYAAGETILISDNTIPNPKHVLDPSITEYTRKSANKFPFEYITPVPLAVNDSVLIQEIVQVKFVVSVNSGTWMCKNMLDFSTSPEWYKLSNRTAECIEFSKDGDIIYFGDGQQLYRISGLLDIKPGDLSTGTQANPSITPAVDGNEQLLYQGQTVCGIGVDPRNAENVIIALGNYGANLDHVYRSTNAATTTAASSFESIQNSLPSMPTYDALIEMNDENKVLVGTEFGVYSTDNAFDPSAANVVWTEENGDFAKVPTYMIIQQTHENSLCTGVNTSGNIYLGTHGRGIFKSMDYAAAPASVACDLPVAIGEIINSKNKATLLNLFPNPVVSGSCSLELELNSSQTVLVQLYDITGKVIRVVCNGSMKKGKQNIKINTNGLEPGTYFVNVLYGNNTTTKKLVVL